MGTLNPLERATSPRASAASPRSAQGLLICSSWHGRFIDGEDSFAFWEWAQDRQVPVFIHRRGCRSRHDQQMTSTELDELVGGRSTPPWRWRG